ncbi:hypothetical protein AN641_06400 [Candidatus Epulonipiscioides gigas]|nr:hypothetical protein AN641_06400 [Epulopiscium sp. SCG-C07WGA-EpuloA2]
MNALSSLFEQNNSSSVYKVKSSKSIFSNFLQSQSKQTDETKNLEQFTSSAQFNNNGYFNYTESALLDERELFNEDDNTVGYNDSQLEKELDDDSLQVIVTGGAFGIRHRYDGSGFYIQFPVDAVNGDMQLTTTGITCTFYDDNGEEVQGSPLSYSYSDLIDLGASADLVEILKKKAANPEEPFKYEQNNDEKRKENQDTTIDKLEKVVEEKEKLGEQNGVQYVDSSKSNYRAPVFKPNTPAYIKQAYYELSYNNYFAS